MVTPHHSACMCGAALQRVGQDPNPALNTNLAGGACRPSFIAADGAFSKQKVGGLPCLWREL